MKKIIIAATVLINLSFAGSHSNHSKQHNHTESIEIKKRDAVVYICNGPKSYAYHSHARCSGLNNCSTQIYAINQSEAQNRGRRVCQKCY
jgi:hypothetical protein